MNNQRHQNSVVDPLAPQQAVQEYLDALLQDATANAPVDIDDVSPSTVEDTPVSNGALTSGASIDSYGAEPANRNQVRFDSNSERSSSNTHNRRLTDTLNQAFSKPLPQTSVETKVAERPLISTLVLDTSIHSLNTSSTDIPVVENIPVEVAVVEPETTDATLITSQEQQQTVCSHQWVDGRPQWAAEQFECLLFKVAGLTLAVPLVELGGVLTLDDDLRKLFGKPEWFLGLLPSKTAGTVKVIDTARWVMPERYGSEAGKAFRYVIMMEGGDWGMACHEVAEAITLQPEQVRWRTDRGQRPWLAGTVIEHMCAIMDVASLVGLVSQDGFNLEPSEFPMEMNNIE